MEARSESIYPKKHHLRSIYLLDKGRTFRRPTLWRVLQAVKPSCSDMTLCVYIQSRTEICRFKGLILFFSKREHAYLNPVSSSTSN
jgi:hypothetical protein